MMAPTSKHMAMAWEREIEVAISAARAAGEKLLAMSKQGFSVETKGASCNLVTEADLQSERLILGLIREAFPEDAILSEEDEDGPAEATGRLWVIDPLDGTTNYAHGFPFFAVSVALWVDGVPRIGVVLDPTRDELFQASAGAGAKLNGEPIGVSSVAKLDESVVATGFNYDRGAIMRQTLGQIETLFMQQVQGILQTGSAVLNICSIASGRLDGYWELKLGPWDYAAAACILQEAGGQITDVAGGPLHLFMKNAFASNGLIHSEVTKILKK